MRQRVFTFSRLPLISLLLSVTGIALYNLPLRAAQAATARLTESADNSITIPGPLVAFQRLAAISRKASPEEVLPFLARNVVIDGYEHGPGKNKPAPTEFLKLIRAYLEQARELRDMAGAEGRIHVAGCDNAAPLLKTLGYHLRGACGPETSVETDDPQRAFLTVDSGFPLVELEEALQRGQPFEYAFTSSTVPVLFSPKEWTTADKDFLDSLLDSPELARLYWAMSRLDEPARLLLWHTPGREQLLSLAPVLDFYGTHLAVRNGRVVTPGGESADAAWKDLVGANPQQPAEFLTKLIQKDEGWLAAYFDALSYVPRRQQAYFVSEGRLKRFYEALRGKDLSPSPVRSVFRPTANLYLLATRLWLDPDGQPHVPGNIDVWKEIFRRKSDTKLIRDWAKRANNWKSPEQLIEAMFSLSRYPSLDGPLQVYLTLVEVDRRRPAQQQLRPATVRLMADKFSRFRDQYPLFSEFSDLDDAAITRFLAVAEAVDKISDKAVKANTLGLLQANVGLWQILARQNQIPAASRSASFQRMVQPFATVTDSVQLFDAARKALGETWRVAGQNGSITQEGIIALLSGPPQSDSAEERERQRVAQRIRGVYESQRLVSLDTLFELGDGLAQQDSPNKPATDSLVRLAGALREFEMPQPMFTNRERSEWASGLQFNPHTSLQTRTDLSKVIAGSKGPELKDARGLLAPFLRDAIVGLNYAFYEPPGAQMVRSNPLLVRSHNFSGQMTMKGDEVWQTPRVFGRGWSAAGGAHLAGSMADLPYVLSQVEQDFIVPENTQSLIWADLVPTILTSAVLPSWWNVTDNELRAVALYQELGEEVVSAAASRPEVARMVTDILWDHMLPLREGRLEQSLANGQSQQAIEQLMPVELFILGMNFVEKHPEELAAMGDAGQQLASLVQTHADEVSWERIARDFGVPHPVLAQTYAREILALKPLPTFLGYSSRLLAETWESSNLYWARLAAERGASPAALHNLVPALTHRMVEKIFATHLEDWPAVLRAMKEAGEEYRSGKLALSAAGGSGGG